METKEMFERIDILKEIVKGNTAKVTQLKKLEHDILYLEGIIIPKMKELELEKERIYGELQKMEGIILTLVDYGLLNQPLILLTNKRYENKRGKDYRNK